MNCIMSFWNKLFKSKEPEKVKVTDSELSLIASGREDVRNTTVEPSVTFDVDLGGTADDTLSFSYTPVKPIDLMKVSFVDTPNKSIKKVDNSYIVLHHTGPGSHSGIVKWLCNRQAKASAHYVLGTSGALTQLVNTKKKAWHAGVSTWDTLKDINQYSIGIEICNIGVMQKGDDGAYYYEYGRSLKKYTGKVEPVFAKIRYPGGKVLEGYVVPYPEKQITKLIGLCKALIEKYPNIGREHILTHYQISPGRKNDPFGLDMEEVINRIFS